MVVDTPLDVQEKHGDLSLIYLVCLYLVGQGIEQGKKEEMKRIGGFFLSFFILFYFIFRSYIHC